MTCPECVVSRDLWLDIPTRRRRRRRICLEPLDHEAKWPSMWMASCPCRATFLITGREVAVALLGEEFILRMEEEGISL